MSRTGIRTIFFIALLFLCLWPSTAPGAERLFDFRGPVGSVGEDALQGWTLKKAVSSDITEKGLTLRGTGSVVIASPPGLGIPHGVRLMEIRVEAPSALNFVAAFRTTGGKIPPVKSFKINRVGGYSGGPVRYRLHVGDVTGRGEDISAFIFSFEAPGEVEVTIGSVRFYDPGFSGLIAFFWEKFWEHDPITGTTVNLVTIPEAGPFSFITILYILLICITAGVLLCLFFRRRTVDRVILLKAAVAAFVVCGLVYTLRMDYNWLLIWRNEAFTLKGKEVGERVRMIHYSIDEKNPLNYMNFVDFVKQNIPEGKTVKLLGYDFEAPLVTFFHYYLMPVMESNAPDYYLTYGEEDIRFDTENLTLYEGGLAVASPVIPYRTFAENIRIFEVLRREGP